MNFDEQFEEVDPPAYTRAKTERDKGILKISDTAEDKLMLTFK
jgi:hypothetical protein